MNIARLLLSICQLLRLIQQCKLRLSPFEQHGMAFTLVVAESDILPINIPVASLQFPYQRAFGYLFAPQQPIRTDIVASVARSRLSFPNCRNIAQNFRSLSAKVRPPAASSWYVPNIFLPVATDVHTLHTDGDAQSASLKVFRAPHRPLERWQPVDSCLPVRPFMWLSCADTEQTTRSEQRIVMNTRIIV